MLALVVAVIIGIVAFEPYLPRSSWLLTRFTVHHSPADRTISL